MPFELTILGCSSATPTHNRHPTAQVLNIRERFFLIDCGEGTQSQLTRFKLRYSKIGHIFISHLHGDHYLGLMGLLSTMHLQGRTTDIHLFGQQELMDLIELQLRLSQTVLRYRLIFHPVKHYAGTIIHEDEDVVVSSIVLNHRVPCTGFLFREKPRPLKLRIGKIRQYNIPFSWYNDIKAGADFIDGNGAHIPNSELTMPPEKPRSFAFCSDTKYDEQVADEVTGVDLLYHEATFMHDLSERAQTTFHSTARQAAQIAQRAGAGRLIIGHFSARYKDLTPLLDEARAVFPSTELAEEGKRYLVPGAISDSE
ncbi:MAG TPA: ribonuclease Z [Bacteroidia bacterium]|nr:ribonuclease Z [Bacteroidia bacterium]